MPRFLSALALSLGLACGQTGFPAGVFSVGPGVTAPQIIGRIEPSYSPEALAAEIQGDVLFSLVVDEHGHATNLRELNPLGFGLDERAQEAISQWRFQPGVKDGKAVQVAANIEVHFGLKGPLKASQSRNQLKGALQQLQGDRKQRDHALKTIQDLVEKKLPDAMYVYAQLLAEGKELPPDPHRSRDLIARAAEADFGPAMFALASAADERQANDLESTKEMIRRAANLGSTRAQYFLASVYEKGNSDLGFQQDDGQSVHYYQLCAAAGTMQCQLKLGELLLYTREGGELDYAEAIAWLELATDQGETRARAVGPRERASLSAEQLTRVMMLKKKLVHPH